MRTLLQPDRSGAENVSWLIHVASSLGTNYENTETCCHGFLLAGPMFNLRLGGGGGYGLHNTRPVHIYIAAYTVSI